MIDREDSTALEIDKILALHRDPRGFIGFLRKADNRIENLFSIQASKLASMFPAIASWLVKDSYFTVNAFYRAAPYLNKRTGLPDVWRKEKHLSRLTACYSDLDCGRPESDDPAERLDWRRAQYEAELLMDTGIIPQASLIARSGRGIYLFWLLRGEKDPAELPRAFPEKIALYKTINRLLDERLRTHQLPADLRAVDAARVLRVPGSLHTKAIRRVTYVIELDQHGKPYVYTLPELAAFLNLSAPGGTLPATTRALARPPTYRKVKNPGSAPLRALSWKKTAALRAQDLLIIEQWRGGFLKRGLCYPDGFTSCGRRFTLTLYANFLRGSGATKDQALRAVMDMARNTRPVYPSDPDDVTVESIVAGEYASVSRRRWPNKKLCGLFGVTGDVARDLNLKTIRPPEVALEADRTRPLQADVIADRRAYLKVWIEKRHRTPSTREAARLYEVAGFPGANRQTAHQDLKAIGYGTDRPRGRPRKAL